MKRNRLLFVCLFFILPLLMMQAKIHVYTCGDSTMANKSSKTERGWGMLFPSFVDASLVEVSNKAADGRSTLSFINEGRWTSVVNSLVAGDYVLIQFGHNDEKTTASLHTDPQTTYKENLTRFVNEAKAKGAHPVLLTPIVRRIFGADGNIVDEHTEYAKAVRELAEELQVPMIDMNEYSRQYENIAGIFGSRSLHEYFPGTEIDNTHLCQLGAYITARCVAEQIAANSDIDIPLNSNPAALDGAYTSTLDYAQHVFSANYPWETVPASLSAIDEKVRQLRYQERQGLKNNIMSTDATFALMNPGFDEGYSWYNAVQSTRPLGWTLEYTGSCNPSLSSTAKPQGSENPIIAAGCDHYIMWGLSGSGKLYQKVENLPDGDYELSVEICRTGTVTSYLYANDDKVVVDKDEVATLKTSVKDGVLEIGVAYEGASNGCIDLENFSLVKLPNEKYEKTDVSAQLVNPNFDDTSISNNAPKGWTFERTQTGTGFKVKMSTGAKANGLIAANQPHWQIYQYSGALKGKVYQKVSGLENGHYLLGVDIASSFAGNLTLFMNQAESAIKSGDNKHYEVEVEVYDGTIELGLNLDLTSAQNTIDFDSFTLHKIDVKDETTSIKDVNKMEGQADANSGCYDLSGRKMQVSDLTKLPRGIYIVNHKKYVVR